MPQLALQLGSRPDVEDVADSVLMVKADFLSAIRLCMDVSGLQDDHICSVLDIQPAHFSKIRSGTAHFPPNKLMALMELCKNEIPLRWLSLKRGYELVKLKSTLEEENESLRLQVAELERDKQTILEFAKNMK